jgi:Protein of unknown function (DUF4019)
MKEINPYLRRMEYMRKFLFVTTFLSFSLGASFSLSAVGASSTLSQPSSTQGSKAASGTEVSNEKEDQGQTAAGMIESAQVAQDYVDGLDGEQYAQSWTKGDQIFQHTISKEEWTKALNLSRKPLGKVKSRKLKDQRPAWDPHGLPRGAYMVVEYDTSFENAPSSGELLTLRKGSDGKWRVLTYQVN